MAQRRSNKRKKKEADLDLISGIYECIEELLLELIKLIEGEIASCLGCGPSRLQMLIGSERGEGECWCAWMKRLWWFVEIVQLRRG